MAIEAPDGAWPVLPRAAAGPPDEDGLADVAGMERPELLPPAAGPSELVRGFAFVDLSGFTAFVDTHGARAALEVLGLFRLLVSEVTGRRGVRVAKWLGDGAMLVGVDAGPLVASVVELLARFDLTDLKVRAGVAVGPVLLFAGDDYLGHSVNLAARLCHQAEPGEVLAEQSAAAAAPGWVACSTPRLVQLRGTGGLLVSSLRMADDVDLPGP